MKHLVEDLGLKKVAVFYQYDAYGFDGLKGTELALKAFGLTPVARGTYIRGTLNVEDGLSKIKNSGAEAVVMIGTYEPCAKFVRLAKSQGYQPIFYNVSFVGADELARRLGDEGEGVIVSQVVPSPEPPPNQALLKGVKDYAELHKKFFPEDQPECHRPGGLHQCPGSGGRPDSGGKGSRSGKIYRRPGNHPEFLRGNRPGNQFQPTGSSRAEGGLFFPDPPASIRPPLGLEGNRTGSRWSSLVGVFPVGAASPNDGIRTLFGTFQNPQF